MGRQRLPEATETSWDHPSLLSTIVENSEEAMTEEAQQDHSQKINSTPKHTKDQNSSASVEHANVANSSNGFLVHPKSTEHSAITGFKFGRVNHKKMNMSRSKGTSSGDYSNSKTEHSVDSRKSLAKR
jgi:hypothetical protein